MTTEKNKLTTLKKVVYSSLIFILGVIVTIILTKTSDKLIPNDPVIVKEISDTVNIIHDYNLPDNLDSDSAQSELKNKIKNLELLNNYEAQIEERIKRIENKSVVVPNLILTESLKKASQKGYTQESAKAYFESNCPSLSGKFLDINIDFFQEGVIDELAFLKVNIYKFDNYNSREARTFVLENYYEIRRNNIIRIANDFSAGKYEIVYGFMYKSDLNKEFPKYYSKTCILQK